MDDRRKVATLDGEMRGIFLQDQQRNTHGGMTTGRRGAWEGEAGSRRVGRISGKREDRGGEQNGGEQGHRDSCSEEEAVRVYDVHWTHKGDDHGKARLGFKSFVGEGRESGLATKGGQVLSHRCTESRELM